MMENIQTALTSLRLCREAFKSMRELTGEALPAIRGWSWYDADKAAEHVIAKLESSGSMSDDDGQIVVATLFKCIEAFDLTRQYAGYNRLPDVAGTVWYRAEVVAIDTIAAFDNYAYQCTCSVICDCIDDKMADKLKSMNEVFEKVKP